MASPTFAAETSKSGKTPMSLATRLLSCPALVGKAELL